MPLPTMPSPDCFSRQPSDTEALWQEAKEFVDLQKGLLILDDTTLDKPYARKMDLVTYHWSGKHQRVVKGIALLTLLWTVGFVKVFRRVSKEGGRLILGEQRP